MLVVPDTSEAAFEAGKASLVALTENDLTAVEGEALPELPDGFDARVEQLAQPKKRWACIRSPQKAAPKRQATGATAEPAAGSLEEFITAMFQKQGTAIPVRAGQRAPTAQLLPRARCAQHSLPAASPPRSA